MLETFRILKPVINWRVVSSATESVVTKQFLDSAKIVKKFKSSNSEVLSNGRRPKITLTLTNFLLGSNQNILSNHQNSKQINWITVFHRREIAGSAVYAKQTSEFNAHAICIVRWLDSNRGQTSNSRILSKCINILAASLSHTEVYWMNFFGDF